MSMKDDDPRGNIAAMQIPLGAGDIAVIESAEPLDDFQAAEIERRVRSLYDQLAKAGNVRLVKLGPADRLQLDAAHVIRPDLGATAEHPHLVPTMWKVKHPAVQIGGETATLLLSLMGHDAGTIALIEDSARRSGLEIERMQFDPTVEAIRALSWGARAGDLIAQGWLDRLVDEQGNPKDDAGRTALAHAALANSGLLRDDHSDRAVELVSVYGLDAWTMAEAWAHADRARVMGHEQGLRAIEDQTEGPWCECTHCDAESTGRLPLDAWRYAGGSSDFHAVAIGHAEAAGLEVIRNEDGYDVAKPAGLAEDEQRRSHWLGESA